MKKLLKDYKNVGLILALFIVFAFTLLSCEGDTKTVETGILSGIVLDNTTNKPISGVSVSIVGIKDATTDDKGVYIIKDIAVGEYSVLYKKDGFDTVSSSVRIGSNNSPIIAGGDVSFYNGGSSTIRMSPLGATVKGTIRVLIDNKSASISNNLKLWLRSGYGDIQYGPVSVGTDGTFTFSNLPVNTNLYLILETFIDNGYLYDNSSINTLNNNGNLINSDSYYSINTNKGTIDTGIIYLVPRLVNDAAVITANSNAIETPLDPAVNGGSISLTFSKPIVPEKFSAFTTSEQYFSNSSYKIFDLDASWDSANTKVTLTPKKFNKFQYSNSVTNSVCYIQCSGVAKDGTNIYVGTNNWGGKINIPVYAVEKIKFVDIDINYTGTLPAKSISSGIAPSKSITIGTSTKAIKLTFNKEIDTAKSSFKFNSTNADFRLGTNKKEVYVSTDIFIPNDVSYTLYYTAVSATDSDDSVTESYSSIKMEPTPEQPKIALIGTKGATEKLDLYPNKPATMTAADYVTGYYNDLSRDTTGDIVLTFNTIPADATVDSGRHMIGDSSYNFNNSPVKSNQNFNYTISGNTLTIKPNADLDAKYFGISFTIRSKGQVIFSVDNSYLTNQGNYIYYFKYISYFNDNYIVFKTNSP